MELLDRVRKNPNIYGDSELVKEVYRAMVRAQSSQAKRYYAAVLYAGSGDLTPEQIQESAKAFFGERKKSKCSKKDKEEDYNFASMLLSTFDVTRPC